MKDSSMHPPDSTFLLLNREAPATPRDLSCILQRDQPAPADASRRCGPRAISSEAGAGMVLRTGDGKGRRRQAFTLVEMLLVLVILATLAAIVIPRFAGRSEQARVTAAQSQIASFQLALDAFEVDNGYYPSTSQGLNALVQQPNNAPDWRGPYLRKGVPLDPWGNPYTYEYPGRRNPGGYDLMSMGPDRRVGGGDDITNWDESQR
jgi:general secretion pathway protein G